MSFALIMSNWGERALICVRSLFRQTMVLFLHVSDFPAQTVIRFWQNSTPMLWHLTLTPEDNILVLVQEHWWSSCNTELGESERALTLACLAFRTDAAFNIVLWRIKSVRERERGIQKDMRNKTFRRIREKSKWKAERRRTDVSEKKRHE